MSDHDALKALLDDLIALSPTDSTVAKVRNRIDAAAVRAKTLMDAAPVPPPTTGRQPIVMWLGAEELDAIQPGGTFRGIAPLYRTSDLKASGFGGVVSVARRLTDGAFQPWEPADWTGTISAGLAVYPGLYCIMGPSAPQPFAALGDDVGWATVRSIVSQLASAAKTAGCSGIALDLENYDGAADQFWNAKTTNVASERAQMKARAQVLAPSLATVGPVIIYTSSNAAAPGTWQAKVAALPGNAGPNHYAINLFPDFVAGLVAGGCAVTVTESAFSSGIQVPGFTWETAIAEAVRLGQIAYPGAKIAPFPWPDNDESHGPFSATETQTIFEAATRLSTGPVECYEHHFVIDQTTATITPRVQAWRGYLDAVKAAVS